MFGLGFWEVAIILGAALLLLGPERLPGVAKQLARIVRDVRRAATDFQTTLTINDSVVPPPVADESKSIDAKSQPNNSQLDD